MISQEQALNALDATARGDERGVRDALDYLSARELEDLAFILDDLSKRVRDMADALKTVGR